MRVLPAFFLASGLIGACLLAGCSLVESDCLYDDFGCSLPGRWSLVAVDGAAVSATGYLDIEMGFINRDGYLTLPTGLPAPTDGTRDLSTIRGPYVGTYAGYASEGETLTYTMDVALTGVPCSIGNCLVTIRGRFTETADDRFTLVVTDVDDDLVPGLAGAPYLRAGTPLRFERE